jgi:hypothetical protein
LCRGGGGGDRVGVSDGLARQEGRGEGAGVGGEAWVHVFVVVVARVDAALGAGGIVVGRRALSLGELDWWGAIAERGGGTSGPGGASGDV